MTTPQPSATFWEKAKSTFDNDIIDGDRASQVLKYEAVDAFLVHYYGDKDWLKAKRNKQPGR